MDILTEQVTEKLTTALGRAPTAAEVANGLVAPWTLANVHNTLNVGQSVLSVAPGDDIQASIDSLQANGGGVLYLIGGTYNLTNHVVIPSNIRIQGVGSGGSVIDFGGGAYQIQVIGTAMETVDSVTLEGFTVQNSSIDLIKVQYAFNFAGNDVQSVNGLSGLYCENVDTVNYNIGYVDTCTTGLYLKNITGGTISNTFLTNTGIGGGYVCDTLTNSIIIDSSINIGLTAGYSCTNCANFGVDQVSITNIDGVGFLVDGSGESVSVANGLISGCTSDGMRFISSSNFQVITLQFSNNTGYGVNITDVASSNNLFVANSFASNTAGAFNNIGTGTLIRSNIGLADSP